MTPSERLERLDRGENPALILRMPSGFALMGDTQMLPGYCMLFAFPEVDHLTDLEGLARARYLLDMSLLGQAVLNVTGCRRVNYGILGNLDPFLHAHVWARYEWEQDPYRTAPFTDYPAEVRGAPDHRYDPEKHAELQDRLRAELERLLAASS
jgi:diadenosine tetraphosphate (Ap4A) HIT family hydrolase